MSHGMAVAQCCENENVGFRAAVFNNSLERKITVGRNVKFVSAHSNSMVNCTFLGRYSADLLRNLHSNVIDRYSFRPNPYYMT